MRIIYLGIWFLFFYGNTYAQILTDTTIQKINQLPLFETSKHKTLHSYKTTSLDSSSIQNTENLSQLLTENSTIFVKTYGSGSLASVSFRGTGASHTKVQWNGVSLNSPMNGQIDFSLYPTVFFDNAELHHGASGLTDGNGALGGSVLINNTEKYNKGFSTTIRQSIGSFNNYINSGGLGYSTKNWFYETKFYHLSGRNNFSFTNISKIESPKEEQSNSNILQYGIQQAIYKKLKSGALGGRIWYFNSNRNLPPSMVTKNNDENQTDESIRTLIEWKGLSNRFKYKINTSWIKNELTYSNRVAKIASRNHSQIIDNNANTKLYLNEKTTLVNRLNIRYESAKADGFSEDHNRLNNSWLMGINFKHKNFNIDLFNRLIVVGKDFQPVSPSLGLRMKPLKEKQLFVKMNVGYNYNYPTFNDLFWNPGGNEDLQPETAKMLEAGISYYTSTKKTTLEAELTAFYSIIDNWIIWQPNEFNIWSPSNLREVENKGIEGSLSFSTNINQLRLSSNINYAYTASTNQKAKNESDNSIGKQLIYVPFHKINYSLLISYHTLSLSYHYNYVDKRFISTDNNWYLPANFLSDINVSKVFKNGEKTSLTTSFRVNNLLNQEYQSIAWRAMPGRNYLLTITFNFN